MQSDSSLLFLACRDPYVPKYDRLDRLRQPLKLLATEAISNLNNHPETYPCIMVTTKNIRRLTTDSTEDTHVPNDHKRM